MAPVIDRIRSALDHEYGHRYISVMHHDNGARTIIALLVGMFVLMFVLLVVQRDETRRRTGSAPVQVVSTRLQLASFFEQSPAGSWIRYLYVVDGRSYPGYDFRKWLNVAAHEPQVCFDPKDPSDHLLVNGWMTCGS